MTVLIVPSVTKTRVDCINIPSDYTFKQNKKRTKRTTDLNERWLFWRPLLGEPIFLSHLWAETDLIGKAAYTLKCSSMDVSPNATNMATNAKGLRDYSWRVRVNEKVVLFISAIIVIYWKLPDVGFGYKLTQGLLSDFLVKIISLSSMVFNDLCSNEPYCALC